MINGRTALLVTTALAAFATPSLAQAQDLAAASVTTAAAAQTTEAAPAPEAKEEGELIVVTATKRTQLLIDVPQSISVVSGSALEDQNASNFQDYLKLVPGLQLNQSTPGQGRLIARGVNSGEHQEVSCRREAAPQCAD